ncbi:beta-phosphoglucomutase [Dyella telluris]|uniref:Beta-phosphoglucomutase n=1 Tax=Dyella telluris TaxID=2763498 RepID=A0A7G8Q041_9GAMM|nr:beta-phosphoglucomutase [Dyella telluris]QNK00149.1 beta-phosphoglucomutase [Dyella telluris]
MDHRETAQVLSPSGRACRDPWVVASHHADPACFAQDESLFALSNGALGVRGGLEEDNSPSQGCFLAGAWERTPIEYHERFPGFAAHTDTRIPVADGTRIHLRLGDTPVRLGEGEWLQFERALDLRSGCYRRQLRWRSPEGPTLLIDAERIVSLDRPALLAIRYRVQSVDYTGPVTLESSISTARNATEQGDDPRIGTRVDGGLATIDAAADETFAHVLQRTAHSDIRVACMQQHAIIDDSLRFRLANLAPHGVMQVFEGELSPGQSVTLEKYVAYTWTPPGGSDTDAELLSAATGELAGAHALGHGELLARQSSMLAQLWHNADLAIDGDDATEQALRFNLFHVFQSSSRDGLGSTAAKGLTGEGYEGHYFWDAEVFMLPAMVAVAPHVARSMLMYRHGTLERARAHARELNHARGALYAWRTISGDECSAYFPSGSAQYHINAAVAWAIRHYVDGTGDEAFLRDAGAEMLFETARVWLDIGHFNPRRGGAFCIHDVTGPDEYTALVDNNHYTNRMAQRHLRDAATVAQWLQATAPEAYAELARRIGLESFEIMQWQRAAELMYLAEDERLGVFPQDDTFLDKPRMPARNGGEGKRPLLLELHPLTIYRHQVCKQADTLLSLMLAGDDVSLAAKRRNFDYYEGVTVHDSTLSASTFGVLAAEVGAHDKAWAYFQDTLRVDLDDLHGNAAHGLHMAAMAGSWLSLAWGYGGMRVIDGELHLRPQLPHAWRSYRFGISWRGAHLRVDVDAHNVRYTLTRGDDIAFHHAGKLTHLRGGEPVSMPQRQLAPTLPLQAVIFDLDGVIADTAVVHRAAWEQLAAEIDAPFDEGIAARMKGVDRRGSLEILLERAPRSFLEHEKRALEERKNAYYVERIGQFGPEQLLPGAREAVEAVRRAGLRVGLASASRNAPLLLERMGIAPLFDVIVDAARIARSKPDPEIFLAAAAALGVPPEACLGVEDAAAGISSIHAAGMVAIGIGQREDLGEADIVLPGLIAFRMADYVDNKNGATATIAEATNINA